MSIIEHTTTITPATVRNMKRSKLEDSLLLFANKSVSDEAEIDRLKAELELRTRERDQATLHMEIADNEVHILKEFVGYAQIGSKTTTPELFAHLAGRGE